MFTPIPSRMTLAEKMPVRRAPARYSGNVGPGTFETIVFIMPGTYDRRCDSYARRIAAREHPRRRGLADRADGMDAQRRAHLLGRAGVR